MKRLIWNLLFFVIFCTYISCKKKHVEPDPILGCTDINAANYNPAATKNDGSCILCNPTSRTYLNSFNIWLNNGAPVANLKLEQEHTSYPTGCDEQTTGPIKLTMKSNATFTYAMTYILEGYNASGNRVWSFSGSVDRLAPGQVLVEPFVADSRIRVDIGAQCIITSIYEVP